MHFFKIQDLLINELGNKNYLKNINDQNFAHFMRGYDKGFYGILFINDKDTPNRLLSCFEVNVDSLILLFKNSICLVDNFWFLFLSSNPNV